MILFFFWSNLRLNYQLIDTIIVIAIPYVFCCCCCCFSSLYSSSVALTFNKSFMLLFSHSLAHTFTPSKMHFFLLLLCTFHLLRAYSFFYPCFFVTFRLIIKDNSNNIFFEYFPLTLLSFLFYLLCVFFYFKFSPLLYGIL